MLFLVQTVQAVQIVQAPSSFLPRDAGEEGHILGYFEERWGFDRSEAVELNEVIERFEQFFMRFGTTLQCFNTPAERAKI
jgi:hypothetical protein